MIYGFGKGSLTCPRCLGHLLISITTLCVAPRNGPDIFSGIWFFDKRKELLPKFRGAALLRVITPDKLKPF